MTAPRLLIPSLSFGVELEVYLPWCLEGRQPPEAPPMFRGRTNGGPIVLTRKEYDREFYQYACERKLKSQLLDYIAKGRETTVVPPIEVDFDGDEAWRHLREYREWDVKSDSSLTTTEAEFQESGWVTSDSNPPNLEDGSPVGGWVGVEITTPALHARPDAFDEVLKVCEFLQENFWIYNSQNSGLHVHVGRGRNRFSAVDLRRVAAFLYAADSTLVQMHPEHRTRSDYCQSVRYYSRVSLGYKAEPEADGLDQLEDQVAPDEELSLSSDGGSETSDAVVERARCCGVLDGLRNIWAEAGDAQESDDDPNSGVRQPLLHPNAPSTRGYTFDDPFHFLGVSPANASVYPSTIVNLKTAVNELLRCGQRASVGNLMMLNRQGRAAYNFRNYATAYRHARQRTIEFRQPAGTSDPAVVVAHARIAVCLVQWAAEAPAKDFRAMLLYCDVAERHPGTTTAFDILRALDLKPEACLLEAVLAGTLNDEGREAYKKARERSGPCPLGGSDAGAGSSSQSCHMM